MAEADWPVDLDNSAEYIPDVQALWASEKSRALLVVLTRRLGPDFARDVHNEMFARAQAYDDSCVDDRADGHTMDGLLADTFWDDLFAMPAPKG